MSWLNILSVGFLMCAFPNLDKANMDISSKIAHSEHGTADSMNEIIRDLVRSLK